MVCCKGNPHLPCILWLLPSGKCLRLGLGEDILEPLSPSSLAHKRLRKGCLARDRGAPVPLFCCPVVPLPTCRSTGAEKAKKILKPNTVATVRTERW